MRLSVVLSTQETGFKALAFKGNFKKNVSRIASYGYDGVELAVRDPELIDHNDILEVIREHRLSVPAIGTGQSWQDEGLSFTDPDPAVRRKAIERIESHILLAKEINAVVIIGSMRGVIREGISEKQAIDWLLEALKICAKKAVEQGVMIAVEPLNRYETPLINTAVQGIEIIERVGSENLGLLLDTFHMNIEERSIEECISDCGDRMFHFHVADSNRWYPGAGHLDFKSILKTLLDTGYKGFVSGEFMPLPDGDTAAKRAIEYLKKLRYLET